MAEGQHLTESLDNMTLTYVKTRITLQKGAQLGSGSYVSINYYPQLRVSLTCLFKIVSPEYRV